MKMMSSYQEQYAYLGEVVFTFEFPNVNNVLSKAEDYRMHIAEYNLSLALEEVWKFVGRCDETIAETEPFKLVKTNPERAIVIVVKLVQELYRIAILIAPFMPETSHKIIEAIKANQKPENLFSRLS
jgi:methionyl-tRNA synthetase